MEENSVRGEKRGLKVIVSENITMENEIELSCHDFVNELGSAQLQVQVWVSPLLIFQDAQLQLPHHLILSQNLAKTTKAESRQTYPVGAKKIMEDTCVLYS